MGAVRTVSNKEKAEKNSYLLLELKTNSRQLEAVTVPLIGVNGGKISVNTNAAAARIDQRQSRTVSAFRATDTFNMVLEFVMPFDPC